MVNRVFLVLKSKEWREKNVPIIRLRESSSKKKPQENHQVLQPRKLIMFKTDFSSQPCYFSPVYKHSSCPCYSFAVCKLLGTEVLSN